MFAKPMVDQFKETASLVGLMDINIKRAEAANKILKTNLPVYNDFNKAMKELKIDTVLVATRDSQHVEYIIKSLKAGKDVVTEKPLCIDAAQCKKILKTQKETKKKVYVTHNYRYQPCMMLIKKMLKEGVIGDILFIDFHEKLDRLHGADYFRRWHRVKKNSGGLMIHKSCHCFDLMNWFVDSEPVEVVATGDLVVYGKNGKFRSKRCRGCAHQSKCEFYVDMFPENSEANDLYLNAESEDKYYRDACVYDKEIDIEDIANVLYYYKNGVRVDFSLMAFTTYEGIDIIIEGRKGRLEYSVIHDNSWMAGKVTVHGLASSLGEKLVLYTSEGVKNMEIPKAEGTHGGSDPLLRKDIFIERIPNSPLATLEEGINAVLVGDAANKSIKTGKPVKIKDLRK